MRRGSREEAHAAVSRLRAEQAAKQMLMSGYRHHAYEDEREAYNSLFQLERESFLQVVNSENTEHVLLKYVDVLGPTRLRAAKNSLICLISPICRMAIEQGADVELSFALSDYYINLLETLTDESQVVALAKQVLAHYFDLMRSQRRQYTKPVANALRYIGQNIYGPCRVADVAAHVGLEPHYFSVLFSKQVGVPPSKYIQRRKLEEAKLLLGRLGVTVTMAAESLGFCDTAHFSRQFKAAYGVPPSQVSTIMSG